MACVLSVSAQTTKTPPNEKQTDADRAAQSEARRIELQALLDWPLITIGDGSLVYFNEKTLQRLPGGIIHVWVKDDAIKSRKGLKSRIVRERKKQGLSLEGFEKYSYTLTLYDFNCKERKYRTIQIMAYDDRGRTLDSIDAGDAAEWKNIVPDTLGDEILEAVCAVKNK